MATQHIFYGWPAQGAGNPPGVGRSLARRALYLLVLLAPLGCAHTPPAPLPEAIKADVGTIGVVAAPYSPEVDFPIPSQGGGSGAVIGAAKGLGLGVLGAAACLGAAGGCVECLAGCAIAVGSPYLAVRFAMDQAAAGVPAEALEAAQTAIKAVLVERNYQVVARDTLFQVAAAHLGQPLVVVPDPGPPSPTEACRYHSLATQGIDTVLEVTVQRIALRPLGTTAGSTLLRLRATDFNPTLTLGVTTMRRVVRTADNRVLYEYAGEHTGQGATFTDWGANDAQLLRDGLHQLFQEMAGEILSQVFGVPMPSATDPAAPALPTPDSEPGPENPSLPGEAEGPTE